MRGIQAMEPVERGIRTLQIEAEALRALPERLGEEFARAVDMVLNCKGRVVVSGMGKSGLIGQKIAATLASVGTPSFFLHPAEGVHGDLGMVTREDVVLALSYSGETEEVLRLLPVFARLGVPVIAIAGRKDSTLGREAAAFIDVGVREEACPMNLTPTASSTATLAMGDALAMAVLEASGFQKEDFAQYHPGGSLGRRLMRVRELMVTEDRIPIIDEQASWKDVVKEMSAKELGMTCVVGTDGKLTGVITDGDIRRGLDLSNGNLQVNAKALMSASPSTIRGDEMAEAALRRMEERSITSLIVSEDDSGTIEGVVHLHHLLRAGVV